MAISDAELTWMRLAFNSDLLTETCTLTPLTHTADGTGGYSDTAGTPVTGVACFVQPAQRSQQNRVIGEKLEDEPLWEIWIPYNQALTTSYLVTHSSVDYRVVWVEDTTTDRVYRRALMRRLQ